jgi:hypothetical protein
LLQGLSQDEIDWLNWQLNQFLALLRREQSLETGNKSDVIARDPVATGDAIGAIEIAGEQIADAKEDTDRDSDDEEGDDDEEEQGDEVEADDLGALSFISGTASQSSPEPAPSDNSWSLTNDYADIVFTRRGRLSLAALTGLLFVNAFWNGIVSVFVLVLWGFAPVNNPPQGAAWWGMFVFLIPFEVIGLLMFGALVAVLLEPFHRTTIHVGYDYVRLRHAWFQFGRTWNHPISKLARIDVRRKMKTTASPQGAGFHRSALREGADYRVLLIDADRQEVCQISALTEGEARWMASLIRTHRPYWF